MAATMTPAECHPDRDHYAKGLCSPCYLRDRRETDPMPSQRPGYRANDPEANRRYKLKASYGLTPAEFDAMLARQGGACAVCRTDDPGGRWKRFAVDHDHETGAVRGLLCLRCNRALGLLDDDPDRVAAALEYLTTHADRWRRDR